MKSAWIGGLLLAAFAASEAAAQGGKLTAGLEIATDNPWTTCTGVAPKYYYPQAARKALVEGAARVQCRTKPDGMMSACSWLEETPPGHGFGQKAAELACMTKMRAQQGVDQAAGSPSPVVQFPMRFTLPK